jgi:hypothetical protein
VSLPTVTATRYVLPLREGGSLPGVVEGNDLGTYVIKFHGAGQGPKALVAEVIVGELFRRLGLRVPELKLIELDPAIGRSEPDFEIQELLIRSAGLNLAVDFLPGAFGYDGDLPTGEGVASRVLWLDAFTANVDRSWRNPNLLFWHGDLWVIDHGACLYFHHAWSGGVTDPARFANQPWSAEDHVLRACAHDLPAADEEIRAQLSRDVFADVLAQVPDGWLEPVPGAETPDDLRAAYVEFLSARLATRQWLPQDPAEVAR